MSRPFVPNPDAEQQLREQSDWAKAMATIAEKTIAPAVRQAAPHESGQTARNVKAIDEHVVLEDAGAIAIEFGSVNNPPYAPLRRGARAAGARLQEEKQ